MGGVFEACSVLLALYLHADFPAPCAQIFCHCCPISPALVCSLSFLPHCHLPSCFLARFYPVNSKASTIPTFQSPPAPLFFPVLFPRAAQLVHLEICSNHFPFLCHLCSLAVGNMVLSPTPPWPLVPWGQLWKVLGSRYKYAESLVEQDLESVKQHTK